MKKISLIIILLISTTTLSQVGIGTSNPKAQLHIEASNHATPSNNDGLIVPRIDDFPTTNPTVEQNGMLVFYMPEKRFYFWNYNTTSWVALIDSGSSVHKINDLADAKSDNDGTENGSSIYLGIDAGLHDDATDNGNIGIGYQSLYSNIDGSGNIGLGYQSLYSNTSGNFNTAVGLFSIFSNTTGSFNTATGFNTLHDNTTGYRNTAMGYHALADNMDGANNTGIGNAALGSNTEGENNTAIGSAALYSNQTGGNNVVVGNLALFSNTTGNHNVVLGSNAGYNSNGTYNVFIGNNAGYNESGNHKLYIENTMGGESSALIYGEFDTNLVRVNGDFQIGNPADAGYAFPSTDGTDKQVLQTDGNGIVSWSSSSGLGIKIDDLVDGKSDNTGAGTDGSSMFLGLYAGQNDDGSNNKNVGVGYHALRSNTTGSSNTALGHQALYSNINGSNNVANGYRALFNNTEGHYNIAMGYQALASNMAGDYSIALGYQAGFSAEDVHSSSSIFIGKQAGYFETGGNKLYIENSNADSNNALIYGEFDNDLLQVNGKLVIRKDSNNNDGQLEIVETVAEEGSNLIFRNASTSNGHWGIFSKIQDATSGIPSYRGSQMHFYFKDTDGTGNDYSNNILNLGIGTEYIYLEDDFGVVGINTTDLTGTWNMDGGALYNYALVLPDRANGGQAIAYDWDTYSDGRIKTNQRKLKYGLKDLLKLQPKSYSQHPSSFVNGKLVLEEKKYEGLGFIAQELYQVIPEATNKPFDESSSLWTVSYLKLIPVSIQAIKDLSGKVDVIEENNKQLKKVVEKQNQLIKVLEKRLMELEKK